MPLCHTCVRYLFGSEGVLPSCCLMRLPPAEALFVFKDDQKLRMYKASFKITDLFCSMTEIIYGYSYCFVYWVCCILLLYVHKLCF